MDAYRLLISLLFSPWYCMACLLRHSFANSRKEFAGRGTFLGLGEASSENTIQSVSDNGS
jgi:hypothetical protein